jgi:hypothetical protein
VITKSSNQESKSRLNEGRNAGFIDRRNGLCTCSWLLQEFLCLDIGDIHGPVGEASPLFSARHHVSECPGAPNLSAASPYPEGRTSAILAGCAFRVQGWQCGHCGPEIAVWTLRGDHRRVPEIHPPPSCVSPSRTAGSLLGTTRDFRGSRSAFLRTSPLSTPQKVTALTPRTAKVGLVCGHVP